MSDFVMTGNLWSFAPITQGYVTWPRTAPEADVLDLMNSGDRIVPKFAALPTPNESDDDSAVRNFLVELGIDDPEFTRYIEEVKWGEAAVPFLLRVVGPAADGEYDGRTWARVKVEIEPIDKALSIGEFLRLRAIPYGQTAQFKGMVGRGKHLQQLPSGAAKRIKDLASSGEIDAGLRNLTLVEAPNIHEARKILDLVGPEPEVSDVTLVFDQQHVEGIFELEANNEYHQVESTIHRSPEDILDLFNRAAPYKAPNFSAKLAIKSATELLELLASANDVRSLDSLTDFHNCFFLITRRVNRALEIVAKPLAQPASTGPEGDEQSEPTDQETSTQTNEAEMLNGLDIESVRAELPDGFVLDNSVLAEAVTAVRSGKHLLLSGPPGTGKSTLAEAISRAVVGSNFRLATATADWTTFDTIGGYMPTSSGALTFEPGIVLRAFRAGQWLVIDEINRADIDKAFGPLFSVLAGAGSKFDQDVVLPFQHEKSPVKIQWAEFLAEDSGEFVVTPSWRLLGTLNSSDKASLFQLSFAFLRRFAVIDVPLPSKDQYATWFKERCVDFEDEAAAEIADIAMELAFVKNRNLGPAILGDVISFISKGLVETASGQGAFESPRHAFLVALRLFAAPQYEGARTEEVDAALKAIKETWPEPPEGPWHAFQVALEEVSL